jgi:hypothetical protein
MKQEILKSWVIVGVGGYTYGSFSEYRKAREYAKSIESIKHVECRVVHSSVFCSRKNHFGN